MSRIRSIFLVAFFFSLHTALLAYVNSSMLSRYSSTSSVSVIYIVGSLLALVAVIKAPRIIHLFGIVKTTTLTLITSSLLLYAIGHTHHTSVVFMFCIYFSLNTVIVYALDLFLEHYSSEEKTGNIRGLYVTINSVAWVIAPTISGYIATRGGFESVYTIASIAVVCACVVLYRSQRGFVDRAYNHDRVSDGMRVLLKNASLRTITLLNFMLQLFFVIMVIYSPLYLTSIIGFSWQTLGILLSSMLIPFVIFPYIVGRLADQYHIEHPLIRCALFLMGIATLCMVSIQVPNALLFGITLFATRVGASILEIMCDSAFFKQVSDEDSSAISIYRNMMPLAYTIGPLVGGCIIALSSYDTLFSVLGCTLLVVGLATFRYKIPHYARV